MSWRNQWEAFLSDANGIPLKLNASKINGPSTPADLAQIEATIGRPLPPEFRRFLESDCGGVELAWCFNDDALIKLSGEREAIDAGRFHFSARSILGENPQYAPDFTPDDYDLKYRPPDTLAFASTSNGDQFAVVMEGPQQDFIIYLSHDIEDIHRQVVAKDMVSFFWNYARLGFAGPEFWIWAQFTNGRTTPIDSTSPNARSFLERLRTGTRSPEAEAAYRKAREIARQVRFKHLIEPEARRLIEEKLPKEFLALVEDYQDLLSSTMKARYAYYKKNQTDKSGGN